MTTTADPPAVAGQALADIRLEDIGLPDPVVGVLVDQLELATMLDIQRVTKGGNDWEAVTNAINEHDDIPRDTRDDGLLLLKDKYAWAVENAPEAETAATPKSKRRKAEDEAEYQASRGTDTYDCWYACRVGPGGKEVHDGDESESSCTVTLDRNLPDKPGVSDERFLDLFSRTVLDFALVEDDDQGELDGIESESLPPVYGTARIKKVALTAEKIAFGISLAGDKDKISFARWRKHEGRIHLTVLEKDGAKTNAGKRLVKAGPSDPDQMHLEDAA